MSAFTEMPTDHQPKKLTKAHQEQQRDQKILAYMDERLLNLVAQMRAIALMAASMNGKSVEEAARMMQKFFVDDEAQDKFYINFHAAEDLYNAAVADKAAQEEKAKDEELKKLQFNDDAEETKSENGTK